MCAESGRGRIVIAGGSGFLGQNLARFLVDENYEVAILTRHRPTDKGPWTHHEWNGRSLGAWVEVLDGAEAIVNLAGRTVDCIKTPDNCDEILRSRVEATLALGEGMRQVSNPPRVWVQMSTAHIYGDPPEVVCDEHSAFGYGLAPTVGQAWEAAFAEAALPTMRQVVLRTSFVLGKSGGALQRLIGLARWGLGGKVGHGRQGMSWIHEEDMNRLFLEAITNESMQGAFLATSPKPISNTEFMSELRRALQVRIGLPAMAWMVRLGAPLLMNTDPELALYGRYCVSRRLEELGFHFKFPQLSRALDNLCLR